ncbi:hypothetical protein V8D89_014420 [Ganoderma adspersum]
MQTQNFPPTAGSQSLCTVVPDHPSGMDQFGFVVNVFNLVQFAGQAIGGYASRCPNKNRIGELRDVLNDWKEVLNGLEPEQRAQFEIDHPGEFDSMMRGIRSYEKRLTELKVDLSNNPWARYLPVKTELSREFKGLWSDVSNMNRDYYTTTKKYRTAKGSSAVPRGVSNSTSAPVPHPTTRTGDNGVEMVPISTDTAVENTERRLIDQGTIDQTERYRSILRVYSNYSVPPGMQGTYTAIQNLVTSLLSPGPPEGSITISPV